MHPICLTRTLDRFVQAVLLVATCGREGESTETPRFKRGPTRQAHVKQIVLKPPMRSNRCLFAKRAIAEVDAAGCGAISAWAKGTNQTFVTSEVGSVGYDVTSERAKDHVYPAFVAPEVGSVGCDATSERADGVAQIRLHTPRLASGYTTPELAIVGHNVSTPGCKDGVSHGARASRGVEGDLRYRSSRHKARAPYWFNRSAKPLRRRL